MCWAQVALLSIDSVDLCFALQQELRNADAETTFVQRRVFVDQKLALFFNAGIYICFGGDKKSADVKMTLPASKMQRRPRTIPVPLNDKNQTKPTQQQKQQKQRSQHQEFAASWCHMRSLTLAIHNGGRRLGPQ